MQSYCLQIDEEGREKTAHIRDGFPVAMYETHPRRYQLAIPSGTGIGRYSFAG